MSHIGIHRVEDIARRRLARTAQVEALPPALPRFQDDLWDFTRLPWAQPFVPRRRARGPAREEQVAGEPMSFEVGAPASQPLTCPRRQSFTLWVTRNLMQQNQIAATSGPIINYPFTIDDVNVAADYGGSQSDSFNLIVGDGEYLNTILGAVPSGTPHYDSIGTAENAGATDIKVIGPPAISVTNSINSSRGGSGPYQPGQRITAAYLHATGGGGQTISWAFTVSITECSGEPPQYQFDQWAPPVEYTPPPEPAPAPERPIYYR